MKRTTKWFLRLLLVLILAAPVYLAVWTRMGFEITKVRQKSEAERIVAQFHQRLNAGDFEATCHEAYKCSEFPNLRQDWQAALEDTRNRGGAFRRVLHSDIKVYIEPPSVRANVVSSFERGELRELFLIKDFDGPLQIVTYKAVTTETPASW